ncbi:MAG: hypothetical protein HY211_07825 [Candidatus Omnitrophica bacterium]|nr:hypothetical protein [Candidatus Omnitrophota bacterium]
MIRFEWVIVGILITGSLVTSAAAAPVQKDRPRAGSSEEAAPLEQPAERPSAEDQQAMMQQMMGNMMGLMMEGMGRAMAKPEFAQNVATFMRNYYKALIAQGFTEEEAMKIVLSTGIPQLGSQR